MAEEIEVSGRLVGGHPMLYTKQIDDKTKLPKLMKDGTELMSMYIGVAVPKTGEQHWNQTAWGAKIWNDAIAGYPRGEHEMPNFAWKIQDGDSQIPNQKMVKPCDKEGYPGHWVLNCSTSLPVKVFIAGKYDPMDQVQDSNMIKTGDYCRALIYVKPNNSTQSPGMYLNPYGFELTQAGQQIISGPDVGAIFRGSPPAGQQQQVPPAGQQQQAVPPAAPNTGFAGGPGAAPPPPAVAPPPPAEQSYLVQGTIYTQSQLVNSGWSPEQIAAAEPSTGDDVPF